MDPDQAEMQLYSTAPEHLKKYLSLSTSFDYVKRESTGPARRSAGRRRARRLTWASCPVEALPTLVEAAAYANVHLANRYLPGLLAVALDALDPVLGLPADERPGSGESDGG